MLGLEAIVAENFQLFESSLDVPLTIFGFVLDLQHPHAGTGQLLVRFGQN